MLALLARREAWCYAPFFFWEFNVLYQSFNQEQ
jgi:hypothetical protein